MRALSSRLAAMAVLALSLEPVWSQEATTKPQGPVEVQATGRGKTKEEALRDGQRNAVEQAAGVRVDSASRTKNFVLTDDTVWVRAAGYVQKWKALSEAQQADGTWEVRISVQVVSQKAIQDYWGLVKALLARMDQPRIMVFLTEKIDKEDVDLSTVQTRVENVLLDSGFLLLDKNQIAEIDKKRLAEAVAKDEVNKVLAIAKGFGAQLFVSGSAHAASGEPEEIHSVKFFTYEAEANLRCYAAETAQLFASLPGKPTRGVKQVARLAAKQALDLQGQQLAEQIRESILKSWMDVLIQRLEIEGMAIDKTDQVKKTLLTIKEIKYVTLQFHEGMAEYFLQSEVPASQLAEKIKVEMKTLAVTDVSYNVIKAKFKPQ